MWNFTFGVEDSLVSTVGLASGIAVAGMETKAILLTGMVLIFVEALSMGVGSFLTDQSVSEFDSHKEEPAKNSIPGAIVMFLSYYFAGLIPLVPYILLGSKSGFWASIFVTLCSLFALGYVNGSYSKVHPIKEGVKMASFGGLAILGGVLIGQMFGGFK